ncbi:MAG TPA: arginase family protein [Thermoleophilaceae bacterium]|nr:arginase family protein [Thermoleophilaceae bacterium]
MAQRLSQAHYYAGPVTFLRAPQRAIEDLPEGSVGVLGVPLDSWVFGRNGQRHGPRAIREQSLWMAGYYAMQSDTDGYVDVVTGDVWSPPAEPRLFDVGDLELPQTDVQEATAAIADGVAGIVERGAMPVVLGGDHYVPYPSFLGFVDGLRRRLGRDDVTVGVLNVDGHFDFWDEVTGVGRYNSGTWSRRISEHPASGRMAWWGLSGMHLIEPEPLRELHRRGHVGYTLASIRQRGIEQTMREALELVSEGADAVYVTFDIDVTDGAHAPGTTAITVNGLTPGEVLEAIGILSTFDAVQALDVSEMIPQYDVGGGRTARYAGHVILTAIAPRILDSRPEFEQDEIRAVFR